MFSFLHLFLASSSVRAMSERIRGLRCVARTGVEGGIGNNFGEKRPLWKSRHKWEDNIMIDLRYIVGARGSVVAETLCYKPEGCGFDSV
jgi:hypothetical protein